MVLLIENEISKKFKIKFCKQIDMEKNLWKKIKSASYNLLNPLIGLLEKTGITPNQITTIGFLINLAAAIVLIAGAEQADRNNYHYIAWFGFILLFAGVFDMLDGQLARRLNKMTKFGALFDSVIDRYSELVMFFGISYYLVSYHYFLSSFFAFIAMIGSIMVSYVRARAEGLNVECKVGLMQRPERILTIGISAVLYGLITHFAGNFKFNIESLNFTLFENISIFTIPIFVMAILTNITAARRLLYCKKLMN